MKKSYFSKRKQEYIGKFVILLKNFRYGVLNDDELKRRSPKTVHKFWRKKGCLIFIFYYALKNTN